MKISAIVLAVFLCGVCQAQDASFIRGDANADGVYNISDGQYILNWLFNAGPVPPCLDAADLDDDNQIILNDATYIFSHISLGGPAPKAPFPVCGFHSGGLGCDESACGFDFIRGDVNNDGIVDSSDSFFLRQLILSQTEPPCNNSADVNGDDIVSFSDVTWLDNFLFFGGPPIPPPVCGIDPDTNPTPFVRGCNENNAC